MTTVTRIIAGIAVTMVLVASAATTSAATITITDVTDGTPTVSFSGFPTLINGGPFCNTNALPPEQIFCLAEFADPSPLPAGSNVILFRIFEDSALTTLSDFIFISRQTALFNIPNPSNPAVERVTFLFGSDVDGFPLVVPPTLAAGSNIDAVEVGGSQTFLFPRICLECVDITVILQSDVEPAAVPAPATFALLGLGLVGVGLSRRRYPRKR